jgi:hypothetical protein
MNRPSNDFSRTGNFAGAPYGRRKIKNRQIKIAGFSLLAVIAACLSIAATNKYAAEDPIPLEIGAKAPDFTLPGVDGKTYSLASFNKAKILAVIFSCNHCPTAQAYEDRIINMVKEYTPKGVGFVVISPNDPKAVRLDELGYTDIGDSFEEMKLRQRISITISRIYMMAERRLLPKHMGLLPLPMYLFLIKKENFATRAGWMMWRNPAEHLII